MIAFFPKAYPEELLYSVIARYHQRSGYARMISTFEDIYQQDKVIPSFEFVNAYTPDALYWITRSSFFEDIIMQNTMFPCYAQFFPIEKKKKAFEALVNQEGNPANYLGIKRTGERFFRFCPQCAKEDRAKFGETYWHRSHQIPKLEICPFHGCNLINTELKIASRQSPALYDAESVIPHNSIVQDNGSPIEKDLSKYVFEVLSRPVQFVSTDFGSFLHYHLDRKYISSRGISRDFKALYNDFSEYYKGTFTPEIWQMQKIFSGHLTDPYYICQIAFWEGITPEELLNDKTTFLDVDTEDFYQKLSIKYNLDADLISSIGDEISKYLYEKNRVHIKPGRRSFDYDQMDREFLPKVKVYVKELYSTEGRPVKLSFRKVEKALSLPPKRFNSLPRCKKYIESRWESQTEFWAREVIWAVKDLQLHSEPINWKHIHVRTNLRFCNLVSCYEKIVDPEIKKIIGAIIASLKSQDTTD